MNRFNSHVKEFSSVYNKLCIKYGLCPSKSSKVIVEDGILDINTDRMTTSEWVPLLEALEENSDLKFIAIRSYGSFLFNSKESNKRKTKIYMPSNPFLTSSPRINYKLCKSLKQLLKLSSCLECLIWENIKLNLNEFILLKEGLLANKSLQHLSFEKCRLGDRGFHEICTAVKTSSKLISVNFSDCNLTWRAMDSLTDVIQHQTLKLHEETWKNSLRNQYPNLNEMNGLQQFILRHNPGIGDRGVSKLAEALEDDLWIRVIDLEYCGVTDEGALEMLTVLNERATTLNIFLENNPVQSEELLIKFSCNKEKVFIKMPVVLPQHKNLNKKSSKKPYESHSFQKMNSSDRRSNIKKTPDVNKKLLAKKTISEKKPARNFRMTDREWKLHEENQKLKKEIKECKSILEKERMDKLETETVLHKLLETKNELSTIEKGLPLDDSILLHIEGVMKKFNEFLDLLSDLRTSNLVVTQDGQHPIREITLNKIKHHSSRILVEKIATHEFPKEFQNSESNKEWKALEKHSPAMKHIHLISDTVHRIKTNKPMTADCNMEFASIINKESTGTSDNLDDQNRPQKLQTGTLLFADSFSKNNFNSGKHSVKYALNHENQIKNAFLKQVSNDISIKTLLKKKQMDELNSVNFPAKDYSFSSDSTLSVISISNDEF